MHAELQTAISRSITEATARAFEARQSKPSRGGCINQAVILSDGTQRYFVKLNAASKLKMFVAESAALQAIDATNSIRVPRPIAHGSAHGNAFLVLEALDFGPGNTAGWQRMGQQLATLHRHSHQQFGWHADNTIGSTPQHNGWTEQWAEFFREQRLRPQFQLAKRNGHAFDQAERLLQTIPALLAGHTPEPALLHGDLWSGNAGFTTDGTPVIYDPATYYGDRETDLAFSEYFGGFPPAFYQGYRSAWPLPADYERRKPLYNLYHVLNHANLFGGGYASEAARIIEDLLR